MACRDSNVDVASAGRSGRRERHLYREAVQRFAIFPRVGRYRSGKQAHSHPRYGRKIHALKLAHTSRTRSGINRARRDGQSRRVADKMRALHKAAGVPQIHNGLRRSAISHYLAAYPETGIATGDLGRDG
jgi:hypothetical protein